MGEGVIKQASMGNAVDKRLGREGGREGGAINIDTYCTYPFTLGYKVTNDKVVCNVLFVYLPTEQSDKIN